MSWGSKNAATSHQECYRSTSRAISAKDATSLSSGSAKAKIERTLKFCEYFMIRWTLRDICHPGLKISSSEDRQPCKFRKQGRQMNAINVIAPYKYLDMWVFDDPRAGLIQGPFVSGADTMIDRVVCAHVPNAENGFTMIFSATPFPGRQFRLEWRQGRTFGKLVLFVRTGHGRLVVRPALFRYFCCEAPKKSTFRSRAAPQTKQIIDAQTRQRGRSDGTH